LTDVGSTADDAGAMRNLSLTKIGAVSAVLTTVSFAVGIPLMAASGVQILIPETGKNGRDWIADVDSAGGLFYAGAWLVILGGVFGLIAFVGLYEALRNAGPVMILTPVLGAVGMVLVTISHLIPIAMGYELVPGYVDATGATKASLDVTADTLAVTALVLNYVGDVLVWGVVVPLYAWAILTTRVVARWIGWLGVFVFVFAGIGDLLSPAADVIEELTTPGFFAFFIFMASLGIALLRRGGRGEELTPA
jgi:hypothetical protein